MWIPFNKTSVRISRNGVHRTIIFITISTEVLWNGVQITIIDIAIHVVERKCPVRDYDSINDHKSSVILILR
jgi:hypothetical protein